jgi:Family of unknown function (DUF5675)
MNIKIARGSYNGSSITGELFVDEKFICHTLELPWKNNQSYVSSIPEGSYPAILRYDKPDKWRIQLDKVPDRTVVQLHTGNFPSQVEGCILVGNSVKNATNSIWDSVAAYAALKKAFYGTEAPISTPDTKLVVEVQFPIRRTEYISNGEPVFSYQDSGTWKLSLLDDLLLTESSRTLEYVYMSGSVESVTSFLKVPLFGGKVSVSTAEIGPWEDFFGITVTRKD